MPVADCGGAPGEGLMADRDGDGLEGIRSTSVRHRDKRDLDRRSASVHAWPPRPNDAEGWRRWIDAGGPAPVTDGNKLSPYFVEALMGFPQGWTNARVPTKKGERDTSRRERLRMLGNAVVPQCAEVIGRQVLALEGLP